MLEPIRILFLGRSQRARRPGDHVDCHCDRVYAAAAVTATRGSTQATAEARRRRGLNGRDYDGSAGGFTRARGTPRGSLVLFAHPCAACNHR